MVPLGLPSARPMAQALRLPFEYYILLTFEYAQRVHVILEVGLIHVIIIFLTKYPISHARKAHN